MAWALFVPVSPAGQKFVLLRPGYSTRRIAAELKSAKVIRSEYSFVIWHYFHRKHSLKAGEYLFESPANELDVHKRLVRGDIYVYIVVIPDGYTMLDIANAIQESGLGSSDGVLEIRQSEPALVADLGSEAH